MIILFDFEKELNKVGLTPSVYEAALEDINNKVAHNKDMDWEEIIHKYNINLARDNVRKASSSVPFGHVFVTEYLKYKNQLSQNTKTEKIQKSYGSQNTINKDGTYSSDKLIELSENQLKDKTALLKAHGFDSSWELISAKNSIWNSYSKANGMAELYSSKITVRPKGQNVSLDDIEIWIKNLNDTYKLPQCLNKINSDYLNGTKMLLIDIADLHLNLQASMFMTGNEYNCDIAEKLFFDVINDVLSRTKDYKFNKIIFCIGGDMLNADTIAGTTTKGTPQDNELHLYEAYERICAMTVRAIDIIKCCAPVDVIYVPGNHDQTTGFKLACYLKAWFRNDVNVSIDYSPLPRKYSKFGKTLFVFAHDGNVKTLPKIIADEARIYWSDVETTEVFLQHLHSEQILLEDNNMRIQRLPTISAKSKWSVDQGYNGKRQAKTFIFDKQDGLTDVLYTPIKAKN